MRSITNRSCVVGDPLHSTSQRLRGFLTYIQPAKSALVVTTTAGSNNNYNNSNDADDAGSGVITAAGCGVVETTEQVVSVRGLFPRFNAEIGDVVVARVVDVSGTRWLCDVNAAQNSILPLSNVTEPGGLLRRRDRDDQSSMRSLFKEGDLVVAEVQRISPEGTIFLHTRSARKYGRCLGDGVCVSVRPHLVRREGRQFTAFPFGVSTVVGINGNVWVFMTTKETLSAMNHNWGSSEFAAAAVATKKQPGAGDDADGNGGGEQSDDDGEDDNNDEEQDAAAATAGKAPKARILKNTADARLSVARTRCCLILMSSIGCRIDANCIQAAFYATLRGGPGGTGIKVQDILNADSRAREVVENAVALARMRAEKAARFERQSDFS